MKNWQAIIILLINASAGLVLAQPRICPPNFLLSLPLPERSLYQSIDNAEIDNKFQSDLKSIPVVSGGSKSVFSGFYFCDDHKIKYRDSNITPVGVGFVIYEGHFITFHEAGRNPLSLFKGAFFLDRYFVDTMVPLLSRNPKDYDLFGQLTESQPWIEWDQKLNSLHVHNNGAKEKLLTRIGG